MTLPPHAVGFVGAAAIRMWAPTWRIQLVDENYFHAARRIAPVSVYTFWHGRMLPLSYAYRGREIQVLASEHRDGEMMGRVIRWLGFGHVRGSTTRGGTRALRELAAKLDHGYDVALTVDGPKGPRFTVKPGAIELAKLSGAPIVPVTTGSNRHWRLSSWDAFEVPKLFASVSVRFGEPMQVAADATPEVIERKRRELERALRDLTERNDAELRGQ